MPEPVTTERPILVVDDDAAILEIVADVLQDEGYPVETALNGATALEAVERAAPRLVLLDMRMPLLDGWGFARVLRERGIELPILVMTAARDAAGWADEIGAAGFLAKPFDIAELLGAVRGHAAPPNGEPGQSSAP
jgi:DNA-binding response OmpR family regulator